MFSTPGAFLVLALYQALGGVFFCSLVYYTSRPSLPSLYRNLGVILLLLMPVVAVGRLVEERRGTTFELLVSAGLSFWQVVLGKYMALLVFVALLALLPLQYPFMLDVFGDVEWGPVWSASLGLFLYGAALAAIGLCAAAFASGWLASGALAFFAGLALWCVQSLASVFTASPSATVEGCSAYLRLSRFTRGLVDGGDCLYFGILVALGLFLAVQGLRMGREDG